MRHVPCFSLCLALLSCARESAPVGQATSEVPIYPYWTLAALPGGPRPGTDVPPPTASAVLVAKGYLLAPVWGMGRVADDFGMDPTVYVFDGAEWHTGRYVDRDKVSELALIRADVPGTPLRVAESTDDVRGIVGLRRVGGAAIVPMRSSPKQCDESGSPIPIYAIEEAGALCFAEPVMAVSGGAVLDQDGRLTGLQTKGPGYPVQAGPDAAEIRDFFTTYFESWGRYIKPRPTL